MAKSRNRSRDARKRAKRKRMNKERAIRNLVKCPLCDGLTAKSTIEENGCCLNCLFASCSKEHELEQNDIPDTSKE